MFRTVLTIALLASAGTAQDAKQASQPAAVMQMGAFDYRPAGVSIKAGQTVRFVNNSTYTHTVSAGSLADPKKKGSEQADQLPAGAKPFTSGDIAPQRFWEHRFDQPGTYRFHCQYHEKDGMSGVVTVTK